MSRFCQTQGDSHQRGFLTATGLLETNGCPKVGWRWQGQGLAPRVHLWNEDLLGRPGWVVRALGWPWEDLILDLLCPQSGLEGVHL